eukprot:3385105-Alexandrium_andersonii.AAC.1
MPRASLTCAARGCLCPGSSSTRCTPTPLSAGHRLPLCMPADGAVCRCSSATTGSWRLRSAAALSSSSGPR